MCVAPALRNAGLKGDYDSKPFVFYILAKSLIVKSGKSHKERGREVSFSPWLLDTNHVLAFLRSCLWRRLFILFYCIS